jgi:hypothetical protein
MLPIPHVAAILLIAAAVVPGADDRDACKAAVEQYRKGKAEIEAATKVFAECVAQSRITSCAVEFDELVAFRTGWKRRLPSTATLVLETGRPAPDQECFSQVLGLSQR